MSKPVVPPAPLASWEETENERKTKKSVSPTRQRTVSTATPLDAAFLCRVYRSIGWFGVLTSGLVYAALSSSTLTFAYAAGVALGALLLKSQEIFGRRLMRPKGSPPYDGWDRFIPLWVLLPGKYVLVALVLKWAISSQKDPVPVIVALGCGFLTTQLLIMAKVFGKAIAEQSRSIREVYVEKNSKA
jgi:hypothetical protein